MFMTFSRFALSSLIAPTASFLLACGGTVHASGAVPPASPTYYVSTSGDDSNPGTLALPFLTISKGVSMMAPGVTVYVRDGVYHEIVQIRTSGTSTSGISLLAYSGESPIIDGEGNLPTTIYTPLLYVAADYITVSGFEVRNTNTSLAANTGVAVSGNYNTVTYMNVHNAYQAGVQVTGDYNTVSYSSIWQNAYSNCRLNTCPPNNGNWAQGITVEGKSANRTPVNNVLQGNTVYNNWGEGLSTFQAKGTMIKDNVSYDNFATNYYISDASYVIFVRNLGYTTPANYVQNYSARCIQLADENASYTPRSSNNIVANNMCLNGSFTMFYWTGVPNSGLVNALIAYNTVVGSFMATGGPATVPNAVVNSNSVIVDNIVSGTGSLANVPSTTGLNFEYNLWSSDPGANAMGSNSLVANPLINATGSTGPGLLTKDYFKLSASSPAGSVGLSQAPTLTTDAFLVIRHSTPTLGAYEIP